LLMVLLDAALHLVYELPYRCRYAHGAERGSARHADDFTSFHRGISQTRRVTWKRRQVRPERG
jgi:hypothetical protein